MLKALNPLLENKVKYQYETYDPGKIVEFLFILHERKGLKPTREFRTYLREAKIALEKYGGERLVVLMLKAAGTSDHHWGFKYIERLAHEDNASNDKKRSRRT